MGLGAQILRDLGVVSIRNLSSSSHAYVGLSGFGIRIAGTEDVADQGQAGRDRGASDFGEA
ncbi:hypothetical protein GCM10025880_13230 [Methylorubrum aminovorans]|nr:hypothetical protein GCM10025880_13230 [Methylorubrum aminovorans]